jgi:hypothetical protein
MNGTQERSGEVIRSAASKVMWVGRATVFLVGLAVILALVFGAAATALAGTGVGATFNLGKSNTVNRVSSLVGSTASSMLVIDNNGTGTALDLRVGPSTATPTNNNVTPMKVNSQIKVTNLNADKVDDLEGTQILGPRGYAHITINGGIDSTYPSQGIESALGPSASGSSNLYCFNLTFDTPMAAVGSPYVTNSGVVATVTRGTPLNSALTSCPTDHRDAAVRTYGSGGTAETFNSQIIFV